MQGSLYEVLGVQPCATARGIKSAYRAQALDKHPDRYGNDPEKATAFRAVVEAFEVLGDPVKRRQYDARRLHEHAAMTLAGARSSVARRNLWLNILRSALEAILVGNHIWLRRNCAAYNVPVFSTGRWPGVFVRS